MKYEIRLAAEYADDLNRAIIGLSVAINHDTNLWRIAEKLQKALIEFNRIINDEHKE